MARASRADRITLGSAHDRGWYLRLVGATVCLLWGHQESLLEYDSFEVVEAWDPDAGEFYEFPRDTATPYVGCMRCLGETPLKLPPPVPVDVVDWE